MCLQGFGVRDYEPPLWVMGSQEKFEQGRAGAGLGRKSPGCWEGASGEGRLWKPGRPEMRRRRRLEKRPELG